MTKNIEWDDIIRRIDEQEKWFQKWIVNPIIPVRKSKNIPVEAKKEIITHGKKTNRK
jgi:hypothetical protein